MRTRVAVVRMFVGFVLAAVFLSLCALVAAPGVTCAQAEETQPTQQMRPTPADDGILSMGNDRLWAGETLQLSGTSIPNDLLAAGRTISLEGCQAGGGIRAAGQDIELADVKTQQNVTIAGETLRISNSSGRAVAMAGRTATFSGTCDELSVYASDVVIDGTVSGDVNVGAQNVTVGKNAKILGTLHVSSSQEPKIEQGAEVRDVDFTKSQDDNVTAEQAGVVASGIGGALAIFFTIVGIVSTIVIALLAELLFGRHTLAASQMIRERTGAMVGSGVIGVVAAPIALVIMCLLVVTLPVAGCVALVLVAMAVVCGGFAGASLSKLAFPKLGRYTCALVGGVIVAVAKLIPILGFLVRLAAFMFLLGYVLQRIFLGRKEG